MWYKYHLNQKKNIFNCSHKRERLQDNQQKRNIAVLIFGPIAQLVRVADS